MVKKKRRTFPHLNNAPIHESVIDVRIQPESLIQVDKLKSAHSKIKKSFPVSEDRWEFTGGFQVNPEKGMSQNFERVKQGYWYRDVNREKIVQFRINGFTYNKLQPYSSWEEISKEAKKMFSVYEKHVPTFKVDRLAVRYINHLDLDLPIENLEKHLVSYPVIMGSEVKQIRGFVNKVLVKYPELCSEAVVNLASQQAARDDQIRVLFDIDAYKLFADGVNMNSKEMWQHLEDLRYIKNDIFFSNLSKETYKRYK